MQDDQVLEILGPADLSKSDEELGEWLVAAWLGYQAEKAGIPLGSIPPDWAAALIEASAKMDSDSVENAALESAFRKACRGDYVAAGRMLRAYLLGGANALVSQRYAGEAIKSRVGKHKGGKKAGAAKKAAAEERHQDWIRAANELLANGKQPRDLAGILAKRFERTPTQIRSVLKKAKVM